MQELHRGLPRVLEVVHHEQDWAAVCQPGQERGHRLERPAPFHVRAAVPGRRGPEQRRSLGQQSRDCRCVLSEQLPQGAGDILETRGAIASAIGCKNNDRSAS
jgi:hypothetical protein